ncbi:dipeptide ABC transporter ATP-binding protein [Demequina zhanjiangensis]|uniref:ABC transporter ATP-binding protein n=1 Tax=Demequina zhanjiangensis TaxID=3051659 RepID=A0ABT8G313_9MICO|nr:ABC transporter ATP-binding protein [Demequina sp. SYSU T00b26]MDN4473534.1 ABC transporter ATP-binding protein [Demequina sp. SYSU T00b26]
MSAAPVLRVTNLHVTYGSGSARHHAVRGVDLELGAGRILAVVGESGSGKSTVANAVLGLLPDGARLTEGVVEVEGVHLTAMRERALRRVRGDIVGYVPQDPSRSLNPVLRIGEQIAEALRRHTDLNRADAAARAVEILDEVGIPDPELRARQYPHELSGGLRQRVLIGIAWACTPQLVVADEPTSALDVTVQRHVLDRMEELRAAHGTAVLLITHDLAVAADRADDIVVMQHGQIVESGKAAEVLSNPQHEYTRALVGAAPGLHSARMLPRVEPAAVTAGTSDAPLLTVRGLQKTYPGDGGAGAVHAVKGVDLDIRRRETFAIVGESGSGKSTTARMIARIIDSDSGEIRFDGEDLTAMEGERLRRFRQYIQVVFQNPVGSLDPRMTVERLVTEPLRAQRFLSRRERAATARELLDQVRLGPEHLERRPAQLSGGQAQRVAIARALAVRPELLVLDEPVSALDVSVQEQVLQLLVDLQAEHGLTYLFISHDLAVVRQISDSIAVMSKGEVLERGPAAEVLSDPRSEYTRELLAAIPGQVTAS